MGWPAALDAPLSTRALVVATLRAREDPHSAVPSCKPPAAYAASASRSVCAFTLHVPHFRSAAARTARCSSAASRRARRRSFASPPAVSLSETLPRHFQDTSETLSRHACFVESSEPRWVSRLRDTPTTRPPHAHHTPTPVQQSSQQSTQHSTHHVPTTRPLAEQAGTIEQAEAMGLGRTTRPVPPACPVRAGRMARAARMGRSCRAEGAT